MFLKRADLKEVAGLELGWRASQGFNKEKFYAINLRKNGVV
jgi:hypothetical protein